VTFDEAVGRINAATSFAQLIEGNAEPGLAYKKLVKIVHPDVAPAGRSASATAAVARLSRLWAARDAQVLTTKRGNYRVGALVAAGDIANLYAVDGDAALLKLPRLPADNDLTAAEAHALSTLEQDGDPKFRAYVPRLIESFTHEDPATGVRRTANVLARQRGFVSLAEVADAYPQGLDPRDAAWMWRRLLAGLGWVHRAGLVHGAVLPGHVLIHPGEHGLVLVDWCYSVVSGQRIPALVASHRADYAPEVARKEPATAATDIYMASLLMRGLVRHEALQRFADGCLYDAPRMRPQDAWKLLAEFDELIENLFGPRRFRPFTV